MMHSQNRGKAEKTKIKRKELKFCRNRRGKCNMHHWLRGWTPMVKGLRMEIKKRNLAKSVTDKKSKQFMT